MDPITIQLILLAVGIVIGVIGGKKYFSKGLSIMKEVGDVLNEVNSALEDKKISKTELLRIIKECQDVLNAIKEESS